MNTGKNITYDKTEQNDQDNGKSCRSDTVHHRLTQMIIFVAEDLYVVDQGWIFRQTHDICVKYTFLFQRGICHPHDRENAGE